MAVWSSSFDNRAQIKQQGERESGGKGVRVSDSGIRQLVQAAWLRADLIVLLSFHRHLGSQASSLLLGSFLCISQKWIATIKLFPTILDCCFAAIVLFLSYLPWRCCRDGGLLEELPLSAFCLQKEG